jgi:hypothetical protein
MKGGTGEGIAGKVSPQRKAHGVPPKVLKADETTKGKSIKRVA